MHWPIYMDWGNFLLC
uniref:Uncharacterized protein n=1 Tax=Arundo donax TaxID=35708 RepID=A0A0A9FLQ2_ARUDO